jgi:hypothetical protein
MSSRPELQKFPSGEPVRPWTQALLTVFIAGAAVYLISNHWLHMLDHWLHMLDALPYVGVVLMMGMHLFMHGAHGGHRGHGGASRPRGGGGAGRVH